MTNVTLSQILYILHHVQFVYSILSHTFDLLDNDSCMLLKPIFVLPSQLIAAKMGQLTDWHRFDHIVIHLPLAY